MSTEKVNNHQFPPGTMEEAMVASQVRNSCPTVPLSNFQINTQINPGSLQHSVKSNEKGNRHLGLNEEYCTQYRRSDSW